MSALRPLATVVIPTFEPNYRPNDALEAEYARNFDAFLQTVPGFDVTLVLTDYMSNEAFKTFLRRYTAERGSKARLLDGQYRLSSYGAANVAFADCHTDIVVWASADCRPRDANWLQQLSDDLSKPDVVAAFPTVTCDGLPGTGQTQSGPLERPSEEIEFPAFCNLVVAAFRRELLEPFDMRLCERFPDGGGEMALVYQAASIDGRIILNYRCNVIHERAYDLGRYDRTKATHWSRSTLQSQKQEMQEVGRNLPVPLPRLKAAEPLFPTLAAGFQSTGIHGLLRAGYIRLRQTRPARFYNYCRTYGTIDHVLRFRRGRKLYCAFRALSRDQRIAFVREHYFPEAGRVNTLPSQIGIPATAYPVADC